MSNHSHNIDALLEDVLSRVANVKVINGDKFIALCPAHLDAHPSLAITGAGDRVLLHCWAGCATGDVLAAMGLDYDGKCVFPCRPIHYDLLP